MKKNWLIIFSIVVLLIVLYLIEMSKVKPGDINSMPTLDNLQTDEISKNWEPFYKVRAIIIDGQSANFSIPEEIRDNERKELKLSGAVVFRGNGCEIIDNTKTRVNYFFILPSLGLAQACVLQPDVAMRWTIRVNLAKPWVLDRNEMIDAEAIVSGTFKIDTSKPYEAAFYLENASAKLKPEHD
jgi:hypothetical protein